VSATYPIQASFNRGEASPLLWSRIDADFWKMALEQCENFYVLLHGGLRRRSGTRFVAAVHDSATISRLFPFLFSNAQAYVLEVSGAGVVRFMAERGVLESGGNPYTIAHDWAAADVDALTYTQFNDIAYFAHADYAPQKLSRLADTNWTLANAEFNDGPYLPENTTAVTLTPAETGAVTPDMTGLTAPSGTVTSTGSAADAWEAFDRNPTTAANITGTSGFIAYDFPSTNTKVADAYWIACDESGPTEMPTNWVFEGFDGSTWIVLDTQINQIGWTAGERRFFEFPNEIAYQSYRLTWTSVDGGTNSRVGELAIHEKGDTQTAFNLTASFATGINDGQGFLLSDIGRSIRLMGSDGRWRWARVEGWTSSTVVTIRLFDHALPDTSPISRWALGAFSEASGFPALVALYDQRLTWGRTNDQPVTVWGSKSADLDDYGFSVPVVATDAFNITLLSSDMNELNWLAGDEDLITGSKKQIRSIGPDDITTGFSALNVKQRKGPNSGAAPIQPISIGGTVLYVAAGERKVRELIMGDQNRYVAPEVSLLGEHAFSTGIKAWAFSENPDPTIYIVTEGGELVAMLYDREQRAVGFARYTFGEGAVESVAIIPSTTDGYDDVYLVIKRAINGSEVRYIEVLERSYDYANDEVDDAFFVDCGLSYDGAAVNQLSGLDHLEGETLVALADGGVIENLLVIGGVVNLPYAASKIHIGLAYESRARTLRFAGPGQDGVLFGRRVNHVGVFADLLATGSLQVGAYGGGDTAFAGFEVNTHLGNAMAGQAVELVDGAWRCEIEGSWAQGNGQIEMSTSKPLPALIRSIIMQAEHEP
jgi:hypothetical protein